MEQLIAAIFTLFTSIVDVPAAEALVSTAKDTRLTVEVAAQHVAAARFAAVLTCTAHRSGPAPMPPMREATRETMKETQRVPATATSAIARCQRP